MKNHLLNNPGTAVIFFLAIIIIVPFCESKKILLWELQENKSYNIYNPIKSFTVFYTDRAEKVKQEIGLNYLSSGDYDFWVKNKGFFERIEKKIIIKKNTDKISDFNLKILMIGDSLMGSELGIGHAMERKLLDSYKIETLIRDNKDATGFLRDDYFFDWSSTCQGLIYKYNFNTAIIMLGVVDAQTRAETKTSGLSEITEQDKAELKVYGNKVSSFMNIFEKNNIKVFWVGLPLMRAEGWSREVEIINSIFKEEASKHKNIYFIDIIPSLINDKIIYTDYLSTQNGYIQIRSEDGIHFNGEGKKIVAEKILEVMKKTITQ